MKKEKKQLEETVTNLIKDFEKENDIKVDWINIEHGESVGFNNSKKEVTTKINLKCD